MSNARQGRASGNRKTVQRLHEAQREFYAGGPGAPLRELLAEEIVWSVPGRNAIAGTYEGIDQVMDYFARRREIASCSLTMHPSELLLGEGDHVAALTEGRAILDGAHRRWWTVGLYRVRGGLIAACWLLPLDMEEFDRIWQAGKRSGGPEPRSR
jgi:ketosteroid isomerase-like protein